MQLTFEAVDAKGRSTSDAIDAANKADAVEQLRRRGLYVTRIRQDGEKQAATRERAAVKSDAAPALPLNTLAQMTRQVAMLLRSGSGLVPALTAISRQMKKPAHARMFQSIVTDLEDGASLCDTLRKHPRSFDAVYCAIVAAGEASATLPEMFQRLSGIVMKRRAMRKKVLGALAYPALLILMCGNIINVVLFFVLPRFAAMFKQLGVEVPISTRYLLNIGEFLGAHWPSLLGATGVVGAVVTLLVTKDAGRQWLIDAQLKIPLFGHLQSRLIQGQVFRTMGMLLESGVGVLDTMELARRSTRNREFQDLFDRIDGCVTSGGRLSAAFENTRLIDPYICQAIHTGEESGSLGPAITFCADNLDETNEELINVITRLLEPIILIGMGIVVGGVAISLFMPLFDLTSAIR